MLCLIDYKFNLTDCSSSTKLLKVTADIVNMVTKRIRKPSARCAYKLSCYLAEDLKCFGFKTDCALYRKSNGEELGVGVFDQAMNHLINKTREKHANKAFNK